MAGIDHDFDGHGACAPGCRRCEIATLRARVAQLEAEKDEAVAECCRLRDSFAAFIPPILELAREVKARAALAGGVR